MSFSKALSARVIAGGEGGDPRLRGEGEVGRDACNRQISSGRSTTSPSHCFAMGPTLSPALTWRRGSMSFSKALSARVIAGGEGGDPRLRGEGEVGHAGSLHILRLTFLSNVVAYVCRPLSLEGSASWSRA
jgi:hypothetical protein